MVIENNYKGELSLRNNEIYENELLTGMMSFDEAMMASKKQK